MYSRPQNHMLRSSGCVRQAYQKAVPKIGRVSPTMCISRSEGEGAWREAQVTEEGWWLVLGVPERGEVLAFRRITFGQQTTSVLRFTEPGPSAGLTLFLLSGPYLGLDQEHVVRPHTGTSAGELQGHRIHQPVNREFTIPRLWGRFICATVSDVVMDPYA
jgi:Sec63 Brl domain